MYKRVWRLSPSSTSMDEEIARSPAPDSTNSNNRLCFGSASHLRYASTSDGVGERQHGSGGAAYWWWAVAWPGMSCAIQMRKAGIAVDLAEIDPTWKAVGARHHHHRAHPARPKNRRRAPGGPRRRRHVELHEGTRQGRHPCCRKLPCMLSDRICPPRVPSCAPCCIKILAAKTTASGVNVRLGLSVAQLAEHPDHVDVTFSDGTQGAL